MPENENPSLRIANQRHFDALSPGQRDYWRWMAAPRRRLEVIRSLVRRAPASSVVDLGCGDGTLLRAIRSSLPNARLCGIDMSRPQIEANRLQDPGIRWEAMDLDREDTAGNELAGRFDIVLATEVIEHLENPAHFLRQALRLSVSGGRLILSTQSGRIGETEKRVGHRRHFSAEDMERLLAETGWTPRRVWNEGFPFHDWSKRAANLFPDAAMREFSDKPYGWAKRSLCLLLRSAFQLNSLRQGAQLFAVAENNSGISRET